MDNETLIRAKLRQLSLEDMVQLCQQSFPGVYQLLTPPLTHSVTMMLIIGWVAVENQWDELADALDKLHQSAEQLDEVELTERLDKLSAAMGAQENLRGIIPVEQIEATLSELRRQYARLTAQLADISS